MGRTVGVGSESQRREGEGSLAFFPRLTPKPGPLAGAGATVRAGRTPSPTACLRTGRATAPSPANTYSCTRTWASGCRPRTHWEPACPRSCALSPWTSVGDTECGGGERPPPGADTERHGEGNTDPATGNETLQHLEVEEEEREKQSGCSRRQSCGDPDKDAEETQRQRDTLINSFCKFLEVPTLR